MAPAVCFAIAPRDRASTEVSVRFEPRPEAFIDKFLEKGNFARLASMSFATADEEHFVTAYKYYLWAFLVSLPL
jgi:hypothetical protein